MGMGKAIVIAVITSAITSAAVFYGLRELNKAGDAAVQVPSLSSLTVDQARQLLDAKGLRLAIFERRADTTHPAGKVISQAPLASSDAPKNSAVFVVVSEGGGATTGAVATKTALPKTAPPAKAAPPTKTAPTGPMVEVPRVTWKGLKRAKQTLRDAGFIVGKVRYVEDEDRASGIVIRQSPTAKTYAPRGASVDLTVNDTD